MKEEEEEEGKELSYRVKERDSCLPLWYIPTLLPTHSLSFFFFFLISFFKNEEANLTFL